MSHALPRSTAPTRLRLPDLLHTADRFADEVLSGRFENLLPPDGLPVGGIRLHTDDDLDVRLISWAAGRTRELHDYAGSLGALTVLAGSLHELRWDGTGLRRRLLDAGDQAAFPLGWVHDVTAAEEGNWPETLSVHAYSPPVTAMSYYEVTERNRLRRTRTELTVA